MATKYDLIVVGGGPTGLMAGKTAAEDGMKVAVLERKKDPSDVTRACLQVLYVKGISPLKTGKTYMDQVTVELDATEARFHNLNLGFTEHYSGQLKPYLNWRQISPSGNLIHRFVPNQYPWAFHYQKEVFIADLLGQARKAGADVVTETAGLGAENTPTGVQVRVSTKGREETWEAANVIAADGVGSKVADSLGFTAQRKLLGKGMGGVHYIVEGLETVIPGATFMTFSIPSIDPARNCYIGQMRDGRNLIGVPPRFTYEMVAAHPVFKPLLVKAKLVEKQAYAADFYTQIVEPINGNVIVAGDAAAPVETWIQGGVACGFQAVKAIQKQRAASNGYADYIKWWQSAFAFNQPEYFKVVSDYYAFNRVCSDEDVDWLFGMLKDQVGIPGLLIEQNMDAVKAGRPELYRKLEDAKQKSMWGKH